MRRNIHPAEELFSIRAELRALRAREAELRRFFLSNPALDQAIGPFHEVQVSRQRHMVLARDRLPVGILDDPQYFDRRVSSVVKVVRARDEHPAGFADPASGAWITTRGTRADTTEDDDFEVIETFAT